jgi:hypothetical protein
LARSKEIPFLQTWRGDKRINEIEKIIRVPRYAIRDGNQVWVEVETTRQINGAQKVVHALEVAEVEIARLDRQYAYIVNGLSDGDVVIVSPLDVVVDGMLIRTNILNQDNSKPQEIEIK